jgi:hypothetical protein
MADIQAFSSMDIMNIMTNSCSTIDVNMLNGKWKMDQVLRLKLGRVMMDDETFVSRLVAMMTMFAVCMVQVFINDHLAAISNKLDIS